MSVNVTFIGYMSLNVLNFLIYSFYCDNFFFFFTTFAYGFFGMHLYPTIIHASSLVIMALVDITNGKNRHVPYRDSRLTFLLQV